MLGIKKSQTVLVTFFNSDYKPVEQLKKIR